MLTPRSRRALAREMSDCWEVLNTVLQMMAHASSQGIYGRGRRRGRSGPRIDTMELLEQMDLE